MIAIDIFTFGNPLAGGNLNPLFQNGNINYNQAVNCNGNPACKNAVNTIQNTATLFGLSCALYPPCLAGAIGACFGSHFQVCSLSYGLGTGGGGVSTGFSQFFDPLNDPLGFLGALVLTMGIIAGLSIAVFGTSVFNAGTAYLVFVVSAVILVWTSLLFAGIGVFNAFPCINPSASTLDFTCTSGAFSTGTFVEFALTLSVVLGTLDLVAL